MQLRDTQFPPPSRHFIPLRSKYSLQHPVLKHHQQKDREQKDNFTFVPQVFGGPGIRHDLHLA
jgi:hypothetical protein